MVIPETAPARSAIVSALLRLVCAAEAVRTFERTEIHIPTRPEKPERKAPNIFGPHNVRASSEILVRDTGAPVSLGQALKTGPARFSEQKRRKKEVDLPGLRRTLNEVLSKETESAKEKKSVSEMRQEPDQETAKVIDKNSAATAENKDPDKKVINPGEIAQL